MAKPPLSCKNRNTCFSHGVKPVEAVVLKRTFVILPMLAYHKYRVLHCSSVLCGVCRTVHCTYYHFELNWCTTNSLDGRGRIMWIHCSKAISCMICHDWWAVTFWLPKFVLFSTPFPSCLMWELYRAGFTTLALGPLIQIEHWPSDICDNELHWVTNYDPGDNALSAHKISFVLADEPSTSAVSITYQLLTWLWGTAK